MYGLQACTREGIFINLLHCSGNGDGRQGGAVLEGIAANLLDGRGKFDVAQLAAAHEPRAADVVKSY